MVELPAGDPQRAADARLQVDVDTVPALQDLHGFQVTQPGFPAVAGDKLGIGPSGGTVGDVRCAGNEQEQLLLPGDVFFVSLVYEEEKSREFLDNLTALFIKVQKLVNERLAGTISEFVTCRGVYFPGLRFPADALVNLSPDLIEKYVPSMCKQVGDVFGPLCLHFCTAPSPSIHVLPVLTGLKHIKAVDNWQGPDVLCLGPGPGTRPRAQCYWRDRPRRPAPPP